MHRWNAKPLALSVEYHVLVQDKRDQLVHGFPDSEVVLSSIDRQ